MSTFPKKGEIWLLKNVGNIKEFSKDYRPVLVISNNEQNEYDDSAVALPFSTEDIENIKTFEVFIANTPETGLDYPSKIICDSPFTLNKEMRFKKKIGVVSQEIMEKVKVAWWMAFYWD